MRLYSKEITKERDGETVEVAGWVNEKRELGKVSFIRLRDEKGYVQITTKDENIIDIIRSIKKESVISVVGVVSANETAPRGVEIIPEKIDVISRADPIPIDMHKKENTTLDKRLNNRPIDLRNPENNLVFRVQSCLVQGFLDYLNKNGFVQVFTPCLMGVASESGSEVFEVKYYDEKAFLRQDPQLHRQLTIAGGYEKIYDIGPCWRAEASHTTQHICEHRVCAVEVAFIKDEYDVINLEKELVLHALEFVKTHAKEFLKASISVPKEAPILEFPKIYEILESFGKHVEYGKDYDTEGQKLLAEYVKKKYNTDMFFVNKFPFTVKPFYVMTDGKWARSVDLIFKGIELSSGGQREHRYEVIIEQAKEKGMNPKSVEWFAKFFRYGVPPHGGFAIGLERLTMALLNIKNIREAVLFPRTPERLVP